MNHYYIIRPGGTQEGPLEESFVRKQYTSGAYAKGTLIWYTGLDGWQPIEDVFANIDHMSPPPPGPQSTSRARRRKPTKQVSTAVLTGCCILALGAGVYHFAASENRENKVEFNKKSEQKSKLLLTLSHSDAVSHVIYSPDGKWIASSSKDGTSYLWNAKTGRQIGEAMRHDDSVRCIAFSPDGQQLATAARDRTVRIWDVRTCKMSGEPLRHATSVSKLSFNADGSRLLTTSRDIFFRHALWDMKTRTQILDKDEIKELGFYAAFSPDGNSLAASLFDGFAIRFFDARTGKRIGRDWESSVSKFIGREAEQSLDRVVFSHDSNLLAADVQYEFKESHHRYYVDIWNANTGKLLTRLDFEHPSDVHDLTFSPDGRHLATRDADHIVRVWDVKTKKQIGKFMWHEAGINDMAYSPDGSLLATASQDGSTRFWNAKTGAPVGEPILHDDVVLQLDFSPDGKSLATCSKDKTVRIWRVPNQ